MATPTNLTAVYLTLDGFVLELLHWDRSGNPPAAHHPMNQPGLTHLSVKVPDLPGLLERVPQYGGTVVAETDMTVAICITDPDGQVIELIAA